MTRYILGLSYYYHDSAATLLKNGDIVAAVQEERFSRKKHDSRFPKNAIEYCLSSQNISFDDISEVVYYEKPLLTFERLLETYLAIAPRGIRSFIAAMQVWLKSKLFIKQDLKKKLKDINKSLFPSKEFNCPKLLFTEHHQSHASAAFFPSPFKEAAVLCMDGVGEWATTSAWIGNEKDLKPIWEINFPHSLGLLYSAFTYYCGFKVNSGEYKLMGLAPYGKPIYSQKIKDNLIDIKDDGSFRLDMRYFKFHRGFRMTSSIFHKLFGANPRKPESELKQFHMDLAASIQVVTEEVIIKLAKNLREETGLKNLCMAGGVALNCVANGKLLRSNIFENIWVQPASGDAGSSLGASLVAWHDYLKKPREIMENDSMNGTYLGPKFSNQQIKDLLQSKNIPFHSYQDKILFDHIASLLEQGKVIGWFNGPMEFGPRALGARSIIGDPRNKKMQSIMNLKIKYRESFRPFAPAILEEKVNTVFKTKIKSPYMLFVSELKEEVRKKLTLQQENLFGIEKLNVPKSSLPAITHVDYSARIQTVSKRTNPRFYSIIKAFERKTGCPAVVNTSFNVRGEPIVCTPEDAYRCFIRTEMDILVLENQILFKDEQPNTNSDKSWMSEFELD